MPDPLTIAWAIAQALPIALVGCALAALLRLARLPGGWGAAGLTGGLLAGALLGATGLARVAPQLHERAFVGGLRERVELAAHAQQQEAEQAALEQTGVSRAALDEQARRHEAEQQRLSAARNRDMRRRSDGRASVIALALAALLLVSSRRASTPLRLRAPPLSSAAAGAGFTLFPGVVFGVVLWRGFSVDWPVALALGAAIGAGWPTAARAGAADVEAEHVSRAGVFALAIALVAGLALAPAPAAYFTALAWLAIWLSAPTLRLSPRRTAALTCTATALIAGLTVAQLDFAAHVGERRFWIVLLVALLLAADGRAVGAWIGWRLAGDAQSRSNAWRRSADMLASEAAAAQIALASWATLGAASLGVDFALAAVAVSGLWLALSAPLARRFAPALDQGKLP